MITLILQHSSSNSSRILEGLEFENIEVTTYHIDGTGKIDDKLNEANAVILYLDDFGTDVLQYLPRIRTKQKKYPILIIDKRKKKTLLNKILSETHGYFEDPIIIQMLAIEIKKLVCKLQMNRRDQRLRAYDLWLDLENRYAQRKEKIIPLRNREFSLLEFFIINRGKVLTRNSILDFVWDRNSELTSNTVDVHVNRLRRKIDDPFADKLIHTIPCVGYKFEKIETLL